MEFVFILILAIVALIGGYFFLKKYNKIDASLFKSVEGYKPFGTQMVYLSAIVGAIFGGIFLYNGFASTNWNLDVLIVIVYTLFVLILCISIYQSILAFDTIGGMIGKSLWMIFSCALAFVIGAAGSFVVFCVIVLWCMWLFVKLSINSFIYSETIKDEDGNTHRVRKRFSLFNDETYEDEEDNVFKKKRDW